MTLKSAKGETTFSKKGLERALKKVRRWVWHTLHGNIICAAVLCISKTKKAENIKLKIYRKYLKEIPAHRNEIGTDDFRNDAGV
ncbi:hypothetical protein TNCV_967691 [Trichonephila clavipes]|nr:hypothetical protein TNCV_967691 [Trichonephila clavipes]